LKKNCFIPVCFNNSNRLSILRNWIFSFILIAVFLSSCKTRQKVVYFQGNQTSFKSTNNYNPIIKADDLLTIIVVAPDEELVKPFKIPISTNSLAGGYGQGNPTPPGYLVDPQGFLDFPLIGKIKTEGLSRTQLVDTLKTRLASFINSPTVIIRIINFKVTVLGDVKNPGTFTIPNERVSLLEAIGIAGDLNITGKRKNVRVYRETDGQKKEFTVDLTSKDFFNSPVYYLEQNDVVYVEPNRARVNSSLVNQSNISIIISASSILLSMIVILTR
jgi:polysaccharide biosynthesis/export protein